MSLTTDLASVSETLEDDLGVSAGTDYQDPLQPSPPKEGNYRLKVVKMSLDKNQDGSIRLTDNKYPTIVLERVEIVEPAEMEGKVGVMFERIYTKPFERVKGAPLANGLADITRAFDITKTWSRVQDGLDILDQMVDAGETFRARLEWNAYDSDHYKAQIAALGGEDSASKEDKKRIRKECTIRGMKRFKQSSDGAYLPIVVGPSGNTLTARAKIATYFPSHQENVKLG